MQSISAVLQLQYTQGNRMKKLCKYSVFSVIVSKKIRFRVINFSGTVANAYFSGAFVSNSHAIALPVYHK
ncbi:MAG TPA: hypothetical protein DIW81_11850 [Planctomycetaceae bacterium]|nr:hypothetical protein [Rubinisphaera sp.]HCS52266.1 hypothetical protein [Planctomycetaceae bacterium]